jgi:hypothetical protein
LTPVEVILDLGSERDANEARPSADQPDCAVAHLDREYL